MIETACVMTNVIIDCLSASCIEKTKKMMSNDTLTGFFKRHEESSSDSTSKFRIVEVPCAGLSDSTWPRPRQKYSISHFLEKTCSIYRGQLRHKICKELFGEDAKEIDLTKPQKAQLVTTLNARSIWEVKRHSERNAVYSRSCLNTVRVKKTDKDVLAVCEPCLNLRENRSLIRAINYEYAEDDNIKFIPKVFISADAFHATLMKHKDLQILQKSLES